MYSTLPEFLDDVDKIKSLLSLNQGLKKFAGCEISGNIKQEDEFFEVSQNIWNLSRQNHSNLVLLSGTLILFIAGRFESFVRTTFEELCINTSEKAEKFHHLPKEMRENLIKYTADVVSNPRKYGHGDQGVKSFVKVLAENLADEKDLKEINYSCISITIENMRPQILADLFKRVGIKNIWETIGEQAKLKVFFDTHDSTKAKKEAEKYLNVFMDKWNSIAHPSSSVTWPDVEYVKSSADFFEVLATVLVDSIEVHEIDLRQRIQAAMS